MTKGNTENGVSIEGEFHIKGSNVIKNGSCRETYAPFAEGGCKMAFSFSGLVSAVVGAVAKVANAVVNKL
ncbi:conserved hypothetical protein [Clostridium botulinum E1 str. 'BoNT E Beluga']|nr:conserved hypothetical protein [Clostridium botulinum E1 str. 'BoNT E Beluga']